MGSVTGYTAAKMQQLVNSMIKSARVSGDDLILTRYDGTEFDAGMVRGPQGSDTNAKAYSDAGDAATLASAKSYADSKDATTLASAKSYSDSLHVVTELGPTVDLNSLAKTGYYTQAQASEATTTLHYPKANVTGFLEVFGDGSGFIFQRFIVSAGSTFTRTYAAGTWQPWLMIARPASTTNLASGYQNNFVSANGSGDDVTIFQRNGLCHLRGRVRQTAGFTGGKVLDVPVGLRPVFDTSPKPIYAGNGGNAPGPYIWGAVGATTGLVISKGNNATSPVWDSATWITVDFQYLCEET